MKAQHALGLDLSWPRVTAVFVADVAVLTLVSNWPGGPRTLTYAWWSGVAVAVLTAITALSTYRRVPLTSALAARMLDRFADPEAMLTAGCTRAVDHHRRFGDALVGIREYRDRLIAVIAVSGRAALPSGRHHRQTPPTATLPVDAVAAGLRQFDVCLEGIDIVSVGPGREPANAERDERGARDEPESDVPPVPGRRDTWLVLRMDPQRNVGAVAARDSVASTLAAAAERLAYDLDKRRITARVLGAEEFPDVDAAVLAGLRPAQTRRRGRRLKQKQPKHYVSSFWVSPRDIASESLERLWLPETDATAVTVRLTPRHGGTAVSVLVRYHSHGRLRRKTRAGLNRLTGRQLTAVGTSLPAPVSRPALLIPARRLDDREQLAVPLDPPPQPAALVGARS